MSEANNIRVGLARLVTSEMDGAALLGSHTYRVDAVTNEGRCDLTPIESRMMPLTKVDQWLGGGAVVKPQIGTLCCVEFRDLKADRPIITRFQPLRVTGGVPTESTIDADNKISIGPSADLVFLAPAPLANMRGVARNGDTVTLSGITITAPTGTLGGPCTVTFGPTVLTGTITTSSAKSFTS